jgi:hypothetical protein
MRQAFAACVAFVVLVVIVVARFGCKDSSPEVPAHPIVDAAIADAPPADAEEACTEADTEETVTEEADTQTNAGDPDAGDSDAGDSDAGDSDARPAEMHTATEPGGLPGGGTQRQPTVRCRRCALRLRHELLSARLCLQRRRLRGPILSLQLNPACACYKSTLRDDIKAARVT